MVVAQALVVGNYYDVLFSDTPQNRLIRDIALVAVSDDLLTFVFRDGHTASFGRRFIVKIEESRISGRLR